MAKLRRTTVGEAVCRRHGKRSHGKYGYETWLKCQAHRLFRRWAKANPEEAPTKMRYRGYSD